MSVPCSPLVGCGVCWLWKARGGWWWVASFGTLLGPEITGPHFLVPHRLGAWFLGLVVLGAARDGWWWVRLVWGGCVLGCGSGGGVGLFLVFSRMPCLSLSGVGFGCVGVVG